MRQSQRATGPSSDRPLRREGRPSAWPWLLALVDQLWPPIVRPSVCACLPPAPRLWAAIQARDEEDAHSPSGVRRRVKGCPANGAATAGTERGTQQTHRAKVSQEASSRGGRWKPINAGSGEGQVTRAVVFAMWERTRNMSTSCGPIESRLEPYWAAQAEQRRRGQLASTRHPQQSVALRGIVASHALACVSDHRPSWPDRPAPTRLPPPSAAMRASNSPADRRSSSAQERRETTCPRTRRL